MSDTALHPVDVTIVGGGLAGMIAAVTARRHAGPTARIALITGTEPGGRARCDMRDGFVLNRGPRALYLGGPAESVLTGLGIDVTAGRTPPTSDALAWLGGDLTPLPQGPIGLARTPLFRGRDRGRMAMLLARLSRLDAEAATGRTVTEWVHSLGLHAGAAAVVHALVRLATYTNAPDVVEASAAVANIRGAFGPGVRYLDGGWQSIVDQLEAALRDAAVDVHHATAMAIEPIAGSSLVTTSAAQLHTTAVVIAAGSAANCAALLGRGPAAWDRGAPPAEIACLELGLRRPPRHRFALGIDEPLYFSTHSPPARLAPEGHTLVHLMAYRPPDDPLTSSERRSQLERLARRMGVGADAIVTERFLARMVAHTALPVVHPRGLAGRPGVHVPDQPGVFVAGDWVGDRGLLADAVAASASEAGRHAARHAGARLLTS